MKITYIGKDDWYRPVYKDENERLWKDVEPRKGRQSDLCTCYNNEFYGEPDTNMRYIKKYDNVVIDFIPERVTW
jgi:hypothetical protein